MQPRFYLLFILTVTLFSSNAIFAEISGTIDDTFGKKGQVITPIARRNISQIGIDGGGTVFTLSQGRQFPEWRNLSLTLFSPNGKVLNPPTRFDLANFPKDTDALSASRILDQRDGVYVLGSFDFTQKAKGTNYGTHGAFIAKITGEGKLNPKFGNNGIVTFRAGFAARPRNGVLAPDGALLIVMATQETPDDDDTFRVFRYTPDGVLDKGFGKDGIASLGGISEKRREYEIDSIATLAKGEILLGGDITREVPTKGFGKRGPLFCRLDANGKKQPECTKRDAFEGLTGKLQRGNFSFVKTTPNGSIFAFGGIVSEVDKTKKESPLRHSLLVKLNADLTLDLGFQKKGGLVIQGICLREGSNDRALGLWADNELVTAVDQRCLRDEDHNVSRAVFSRFNARTGDPDRDFGENGKLVPRMTQAGDISAHYIDSRNRITTAGTLVFEPGEPAQDVLVRYLR